jgi:hypothetical protein
MSRHFYLIRYDGKLYADKELFIDAVAGGERTFIRMIASKETVGDNLLGEPIFSLTSEQLKACESCQPVIQDFDDAFIHFNVLSKKTIREIAQGDCAAFPNAAVITAAPEAAREQFKCRQVSFFRVRDLKYAGKYNVVPKMATVKLCGRLYIALDAVDVRVETPVIVTIDR